MKLCHFLADLTKFSNGKSMLLNSGKVSEEIDPNQHQNALLRQYMLQMHLNSRFLYNQTGQESNQRRSKLISPDIFSNLYFSLKKEQG